MVTVGRSRCQQGHACAVLAASLALGSACWPGPALARSAGLPGVDAGTGNPAGGQVPISLEASATVVSPGLTAAASASDDHEWNLSVVPLPILATLALQEELRHTHGPLDQYAIAAVSWNWSGRDVYDPTTTSATVSVRDPLLGPVTLPRPVASYANADGGLAPFFDARLGWGLNFLHDVRVSLIGHYMASNLEPSSSAWIAQGMSPQLAGTGLDNYYDPAALIDGPILTVGPHLDYLGVDDLDFPSVGWQGRAAADFGPSWLLNRTKQGAPNEFALYRAELARFFPIGTGKDKTVLANLLAGYGTGDIPMYFRYSSGGGIYQRGYLWDRFGGDQMLVGTLEFRDLAWPKLIPAAGIGLMYDAYADYGRVWESKSEFVGCPGCGSGPIPFPQDMRLGVGAGLGLEIGRATLGRLDLMWGNEGAPYQPLFGQASTWEKIIPGVGLSLQETW